MVLRVLCTWVINITFSRTIYGDGRNSFGTFVITLRLGDLQPVKNNKNSARKTFLVEPVACSAKKLPPSTRLQHHSHEIHNPREKPITLGSF